MVMVSHFHYDPVWWNTQASYTTDWDFVGPDWSTRPAFVDNGFALVEAHLKLAVRDPDYHFVLAELDYLKPYFDTYPSSERCCEAARRGARSSWSAGPTTSPTPTSPVARRRSATSSTGSASSATSSAATPIGLAARRVRSRPAVPGLAAKAGLTGSAWARGPHHQWGPLRQHWDQDRTGDVTVMQFESEFEWISPSGDGVLTHYMPDHYGPGGSSSTPRPSRPPATSRTASSRC
jgi:hypothetical protein